MKKNDLLTGFCHSMGYNGEGIIHHEGTTVFVPYLLFGETAVVKILKVKGNVAYAKVEEILERSPERVEAKCPVFSKCGGCQLQHLNYSAQHNVKVQTVKTCFLKIAGIEIGEPKVVFGEDEYGYRNKLQLPVREVNGVNKVGFFRENSHDVIDIDNCLIHPKWAKTVIKTVKEFIAKNSVSCYDDTTNKGLLRHVVVREVAGEFIFVFVVNGDKLNGVNRLIDGLLSQFDKISVFLNVNKSRSNVILGDRYIKLYGSGVINLFEQGVGYQIGPQSFLQVNTEVKEMLYDGVLSAACLDKDTVCIDGYSGAGVLTAMLAKKCKKAYGVEIIKEAVEAADDLAKANGLDDKMESICAPCEEVLPSLIERIKNEGKNTVLVLDPPRKGVELNVLQAALKSLPDRIIYVACSPQSLARDVGVLTGRLKEENGALIRLSADFLPKYEVKQVVLYDLFPQTKHIETLCVLKRI